MLFIAIMQETVRGQFRIFRAVSVIRLVSTDNVIVIYNNATAWAFFVDPTGTGSWIAQSVGGTNHSDITHGDKIIVYNNANGYAFSVDDSGVGSWTVQDIGSTNHSVITSR
jgi:hypothetical protein